MKLKSNLGMVLLAIWLILQGLIPLLALDLGGLKLVLPVLAIAAGVALLINK